MILKLAVFFPYALLKHAYGCEMPKEKVLFNLNRRYNQMHINIIININTNMNMIMMVCYTPSFGGFNCSSTFENTQNLINKMLTGCYKFELDIIQAKLFFISSSQEWKNVCYFRGFENVGIIKF